MNGILAMFAGMPRWAQAAVVVVALAGGAGVVMLFGGTNALLVVGVGVAIVIGLLLGYRALLGAMAARRSGPMGQAISGNAGQSPMGISEPARRARLDDLRKNFDSGIEKFRAAGKNLYALPWYLLVGEPGSGKTEAIRHCNVGFPPGLQDQLQGAGGTLNMNWWFTNHAVILDTAGRLMFEEVEPGTSSEWQEFLKLLRKNRPNCPVNGMLLVIPAESLIVDTSDALERKGAKIAAQLDQIQRLLGVRFPVFVVVTKCDLINGFREFFDDMRDPAAQHQMLGWSNPAGLDQTFNPELVEQHLRSVQERLMRRRMALMQDPVHSEDARARRTDQVDALYAFPESLMKIGPRLKRYLEMIFVAGEWSAKPLFLRGIYFTSSMREGSALDADLAEALGVPVEALPEGRVWERDRAYFLRDLFMNKVFKEKGLVTRASNTTKQQMQRRLLVAGFAAVGLVGVTLLTWMGSKSLKSTIVGPSDFWVATAKAYVERGLRPAEGGMSESYLPVVAKLTAGDESFQYRGDAGIDAEPLKDLPVEAERKRIARFPLELRSRAEERIGVPWVFYPVAAATGDVGGNLAAEERIKAARVVFEGSVLRPLIDAAKVRLTALTDEGAEAGASVWTSEATGGLAQLIRLEIAGIEGAPASLKKPIELDPLLRLALSGNEAYRTEGAAEDAAALQEALAEIYGGDGEWPPASIGASNAGLIGRAVERFVSGWSGQLEGRGSGDLAKVMDCVGALRAFDDAERGLLEVMKGRVPGAGVNEEAALVGAWREKFAAVKAATGVADEKVRALGRRDLQRAFDDGLGAFRSRLGSEFDAISKEVLPAAGGTISPKEGSGDSKRIEALKSAATLMAGKREELLKDSPGVVAARGAIPAVESVMLGSGGEAAYSLRFRAYEIADRALTGARGAGEGAVEARVREAESSRQRDAQAVQELLRGWAPAGESAASRQAEATAAVTAALTNAERWARTGAVARYLEGAPTTVDAMASAVERRALTEGWNGAVPGVPLTGAGAGRLSAKYAPDAAAAELKDVEAARRALAGNAETDSEGTNALRGRFQPVSNAAAAYVKAYAAYWSDGLAESLGVTEAKGWPERQAALTPAENQQAISAGLDAAVKLQESAGQKVRAAVARAGGEGGARDDLDRLMNLAQQGRTTLANAAFEANARKVMANWVGLGAEPVAARKKLLPALSTIGGVNDHLILTPFEVKESDLVQRYWRDLTLKSLRSLARDSARVAAEALAELKGKGRFPLAKAAEGGAGQLTLAEVLAAQRAHERLAVSFGASATDKWTGQVDIDAEIRTLTGREAIGDSGPWLEKVGAMLAVLPKEEGQKIACRAVVLKTRPGSGGAESVNAYIPYMKIAGGEGGGGKVISLYGGDEPELGSVGYPSAGVELRFLESDKADGNPLARLAIPGEWGGLWLIEAFGGKPLRPGTRTWEVETLVDNQGKKQSLWLRLEFDRDLPDPAVWPR